MILVLHRGDGGKFSMYEILVVGNPGKSEVLPQTSAVLEYRCCAGAARSRGSPDFKCGIDRNY